MSFSHIHSSLPLSLFYCVSGQVKNNPHIQPISHRGLDPWQRRAEMGGEQRKRDRLNAFGIMR